MQISQLASGKNKNFRIQLKTQLTSKQKQKNRSQSQQIKDNQDNINIKKDDFCLNPDNTIKPKRSVSIISLLNLAKVTDYNRDPSKLKQNVKKLPLTLTSKQKLIIVGDKKNNQKTKNRSQISDINALVLKQLKENSFSDQKQNLPQLDYFGENIFYMVQNQTNLIKRKKNQKLSLSQKNLYEDEIIQKRGQKKNQIQINQQIFSNSNCQKQIQKDFKKNENLSWQEQFQNVFFKKFKITNQFSLSLNNLQIDVNKKSVGTQADFVFPTQDKYFLQYVRYRELKVKHYEQVQQKQTKIKEMIQESLQFANHYQLFNDSINEPPFTDREKRVFYLGKQLQAAQVKVKQAISKVHTVQKQSETYLQKTIPEMQHKKSVLFVSIMNLTKTFLLEKQKQQKKRDRKAVNKNEQQMRKQKTYCNILKRVLNQFKYLKKLDGKENQTINTVLGQYQQEVKQFQKSYIEWSGLYYESRVLIYNFMRQIQKIPEIMIKLFGFKSKQDTDKPFSPEQQFDEYMSAKCEQCYHTNKKVKFLQETNEQIKPILKSLEWLIRDMTKKRTCISII